jgi:hypothetical protein
MTHPLRVRATLNSVQEFLFVQEKIASQYALVGELLKEIAGGDGHLTKRLFLMAGFPRCESFACFGESLPIEQIAALSSGTLEKAGDSTRFASRAKSTTGLNKRKNARK